MPGSRYFIGLLAALSALVFLSQCQSMSLDMRKSGTLPWVEMEGVYYQEVIDACDEEFRERGYHLAGVKGSYRLYEKPGTTMDFLAWGGFSREDEIVERLNVYVREAGSGVFEVECQPFIVTSAGSHMEEARKISRLKSGKYQEMLAGVKERVLSGRDSMLGVGME